MSQRYPIMCEFCLKVLDTIGQNRLYDMRRKHAKLMFNHRNECPHWNLDALKAMARAG